MTERESPFAFLRRLAWRQIVRDFVLGVVGGAAALLTRWLLS